MLVEDEALVAMELEDLLAELGCAVVCRAATVAQAMEHAKSAEIDAAFLDVNIGGSEVYPVADKLADRKVPFIFLTGYGGRAINVAYRDNPVVAKPFFLPDLKRAVALLRGDPAP
jgi:CheY-like chemotaxis protein